MLTEAIPMNVLSATFCLGIVKFLRVGEDVRESQTLPRIYLQQMEYQPIAIKKV